MDILSFVVGKKAGGGGSEPSGTIDITNNGNHNVKSYAVASVSVPNTYTAEDEGKVVKNGELAVMPTAMGVSF
jgi:hypothetical protein